MRAGSNCRLERLFIHPRMWTVACLLATVVAFSGTASADIFVLDATANPMAGVYLAVGGGHYNAAGASESFSHWDPAAFGVIGVEVGIFDFSQGYVPENPNSALPCVSTRAAYCYNTAQFFAANSSLPVGYGPSGGVAIYDSAGDPLGLMTVICGPDAVCDMKFFSGIGGGPIDIAAQPAFLQDGLINDPRIVYTDGSQDAIDAQFYDGTVDSFEFVLTPAVPEPASMLLLATVLVGFGRAVRRKLHSPAKAKRSGSR